MATVRTRVNPIDRDVKLIIDETLSPTARSRQFADQAQIFIHDADETNRRVLGRIPPRKVFVDGSEGRQLQSVMPNGVIVAEWELVGDVLIWIGNDLVAHSPVGREGAGDKHPGLYKASHTLFADGTEVPRGSEIPPASEYIFMNQVDYSRKIERGQSRQFQNVYEGTAARSKARFGNIAKIGFTFRGGVNGRLGAQLGPVTAKVGEAGAVRGAGGRFAAGNANMRRVGGIQVHNVSSNRFPAIYVRL